MNIQRLSHIGIAVADVDRSIAFYRDVFGFKQLSSLDVRGGQAAQLLGTADVDFHAVYLERDNTRIELLCYRHPPLLTQEGLRPMHQAGLTHLSFRVSDMDATIAAVQAAGGQALPDTRVENPEYRMKAVFVTDPDGLRIELLESPADPDYLPGS